MARRQGEISITKELWEAIVDYHICENRQRTAQENEKIIIGELQRKSERALIRKLYIQWTTSKDPVEKDKLKKQWLDLRGIPEDFRY